MALAIVIMPTLGWNWLLGISAAPALIFGLVCFKLPESARYHASTGHTDKALETLKTIAKDNKTVLTEGKLAPLETTVQRGNFSDLLAKEHLLHTLILWLIWFIHAFSYYGIILLTTEM